MKVTKEHQIDAGEKDSDGFYGYFYEYDIFTFTDKGVRLTARKYNGEESAHFLRIEREGKESILKEDDLKSTFVSAAIEYLREDGIKEIEYLSNSGYERI